MHSFLVNYILLSAKYFLITYIASHFNDMSNEGFSTASTFELISHFIRRATSLCIKWSGWTICMCLSCNNARKDTQYAWLLVPLYF